MPTTALSSALDVLKQFGVFEVYLPFLLTFALFYGLLKKMNLFGEGSNKITTVVAGVVAAYVMIFSPAAIPISQFFATFFTQASVLLVVLLVGVMVVGLLWSSPHLGLKVPDLTKLSPWIILMAFLIVFGMFFSSGGVQLFSRVIPSGVNISGEDVALILLVLMTIGVIFFLVSGDKEERSGERGHGWRLAPY